MAKRPAGDAGVGNFAAMESALYGNVEDDEDLMNELLALESEEATPPPPPVRSSPAKQAPPAVNNRKPPAAAASGSGGGVNFATIDRLARQISHEATIRDDENDASVENDADLLGELSDLLDDDSAVPMTAPPAAASAAVSSQPPPSTTRQRPADLPVTVETCQPTPPALPPRAAAPPAAAAVSSSAAGPPVGVCVSAPPSANQRAVLVGRRNQYKTSAVSAKDRGDKTEAVRCYKIAKQFDAVIAALDNGETVDMSTIPPSPGPTGSAGSTSQPPERVVPLSSPSSQQRPPAAAAPTQARTPLEALEQRLAKYRETAAHAKQEGNDRRARQSERIAKQYQDAIRACKAGRPVDFDELPVPPGFPPIPASAPAVAPKPSPVRSPAGAPTRSPTNAAASSSSLTAAARVGGCASPSSPQQQGATGGGGGPTPPKQSRQEQQLQFLKHRQMQFKEAALLAKRRGDVPLAKQFLTQAKGFDQMIVASQGGVRVDISNVPTPPQVKTSAVALQPTVNPVGGGSVAVQGSREEIMSTLERDLIHQVQVCERNQQYFTRLGDVGQVNRFEKMANVCKKDLVALRQASKVGDPVPRFRYETRSFPTLETCPDLSEDDLELAIVRAIQLRLPDGYSERDADVFVKWELQYPQERPQTGKTHSIGATASPTFGERMRLKIARKSRAFQRMIKRQGIKFEVYQKGGFLRSDKLLGTCETKLVALETECQVHESLDLLDGRRPAGGKLEVKVRIREPLTENKPTETKEKWLVIDEFIAHPRRVASSSRPFQQQELAAAAGARPMARRVQQAPRKLSNDGGDVRLQPQGDRSRRRSASPSPAPDTAPRGLRRIHM